MVLYSKHVTSICFKFFTKNIAVFAIIKKKNKYDTPIKK